MKTKQQIVINRTSMGRCRWFTISKSKGGNFYCTLSNRVNTTYVKGRNHNIFYSVSNNKCYTR